MARLFWTIWVGHCHQGGPHKAKEAAGQLESESNLKM